MQIRQTRLTSFIELSSFKLWRIGKPRSVNRCKDCGSLLYGDGVGFYCPKCKAYRRYNEKRLIKDLARGDVE